MNRRLSEPLRWANILLRGLHMAAVVVLGAALLGAPVSAGRAVAALVATGAIMLALDTWRRPGHLLEASGGVRPETVAAIAATGVERISAGAITHHAVAVDLAFDIDPA